MSKKINLFGRCLGLTTNWNQKFQFYGKSLILFKKYFFLTNSIKNVTMKKNYQFLNEMLEKNFQVKISKFSFNLTISLYKFKVEFLKKLCFFLTNSLFYQFSESILLKIKFLAIENHYFSSKFFNNLIHYLIFKKNFTPKKTFNFFIKLLNLNLFSTIISTSKNGILFKKLVGFKIQLKGRFENSKNSMSKKLFFKIGKINSTDLNSCVVFYKHFFYSKLGLSSLKIWLHYKLIKNT